MKILRRVVTSAIGLAFLLTLSSAAKASPIIYDASGTFGGGQYTLGGLVYLDPADPTYVVPDFTVTGLPQGVDPDFTFGTLQPTQNDPADALSLRVVDTSGFTLNVKFYTAALQAGGSIELSSTTFPNPLLSSQTYVSGPSIALTTLDQGSFNPIGAPEPASMAMLASGLFAAGGFGLYRRRRETPAI
jgi:hypothetical protein